ncbi:MAG: hypothetical protein P857_381 [Candidatus Xenolissoclinum pacificiensis L6]|uniref:Uncharacterized protein n=1 Tax=Candidatus Xenolissoclinum pacificiensis L6 TaxID=1401685 RepID=W2UZ89_9RICK|nr:MAG: hypothetical protein P857_381 [Candidatus Xenolissoclinum pacificiensis L6]
MDICVDGINDIILFIGYLIGISSVLLCLCLILSSKFIDSL